jgi:hypothetical protein
MGKAGNIHSTPTAADPVKRAYFDLEDSIHDLLIMARIASDQVHDCVGELKCVDGEPIEAPTGRAVEDVLFTSSHVVQLLKKLRDDYERGFETLRQGAAR